MCVWLVFNTVILFGTIHVLEPQYMVAVLQSFVRCLYFEISPACMISHSCQYSNHVVDTWNRFFFWSAFYCDVIGIIITSETEHFKWMLEIKDSFRNNSNLPFHVFGIVELRKVSVKTTFEGSFLSPFLSFPFHPSSSPYPLIVCVCVHLCAHPRYGHETLAGTPPLETLCVPLWKTCVTVQSVRMFHHIPHWHCS